MHSEAPVAVGTIAKAWTSSTDRHGAELIRKDEGSLFAESWGVTSATEIDGETAKLSPMETLFTKFVG